MFLGELSRDSGFLFLIGQVGLIFFLFFFFGSCMDWVRLYVLAQTSIDQVESRFGALMNRVQ